MSDPYVKCLMQHARFSEGVGAVTSLETGAEGFVRGANVWKLSAPCAAITATATPVITPSHSPSPAPPASASPSPAPGAATAISHVLLNAAGEYVALEVIARFR